MAAVMIGVDPAKRSHAMAVLDDRETQLAALQVGNDSAGYRDMLRLARRWPQRTWAVEGAAGVGVQLAQRLVADGETVLEVPPKLSTRARVFDVGHGRKNDPGDARTVAVVAIRTSGLHRVVPDDEMAALRLMSERRRDLVRSRTQTVNHLHQLLMELIPAGAGRNLTAKKAKALLATVRPRDVAGRTRRQLAVDLVEDPVGLDRRLKELDKRLHTAVAATRTTLTEIRGVGTVTAAMILGEVGDVRRFPTRHQFATYSGVAPIEGSSGEVERHRLSRAGNRQLNHALHIIALSNKRYDSRGRAYYAKKVAAGAWSKGALRCLKRRLSDSVYRRLVDDQQLRRSGARVGTWGRLFNPARPAHTPTPTLRSSHTPGSTRTLCPGFQPRLDGKDGARPGARRLTVVLDSALVPRDALSVICRPRAPGRPGGAEPGGRDLIGPCRSAHYRLVRPTRPVPSLRWTRGRTRPA